MINDFGPLLDGQGQALTKEGQALHLFGDTDGYYWAETTAQPLDLWRGGRMVSNELIPNLISRGILGEFIQGWLAVQVVVYDQV